MNCSTWLTLFEPVLGAQFACICVLSHWTNTRLKKRYGSAYPKYDGMPRDINQKDDFYRVLLANISRIRVGEDCCGLDGLILISMRTLLFPFFGRRPSACWASLHEDIDVEADLFCQVQVHVGGHGHVGWCLDDQPSQLIRNSLTTHTTRIAVLSILTTEHSELPEFSHQFASGKMQKKTGRQICFLILVC